MDGYNSNSVSNSTIDDWDKSWFLIGDQGGNPFIINLNEKETTSKVYTAWIGEREWNFRAVSEIKTSPQDYLAYWYLGKVQYHEGEYIKAKRNFQKVIELDPTMDYSAGQWLEDIAEKLEQGPQLVK